MERAGLRVPRSAAVEVDARGRARARRGRPARDRAARLHDGRRTAAASRAPRPSTARCVAEGLAASPIGQVLVEESVIGWGEFELEVMRDRNDNVVIVCSIENIDPMGVHTGDSVTVAPQQTLTDAQYQELRDQALAVIRAVGVETGGSNIQFAVNPETDEIVVIEMNPRVSRSSALASKATGFPIAKIAARLAVGYALEEIDNDITRKTPASFEPTIDYVVVKWPRFAFEKFPGADGGLHTSMQSVGEAMAIGRTFKQAFVKAMRSRELDVRAAAFDGDLLERLETPSHDRYELLFEARAPRRTARPRSARAPAIDPWFVAEIAALARGEDPEAGLERSLQVGRHLRRRVRGRDALLLLGLGAPRPAHEVRRGDRPERRDPRLRAEPDRAGHRVRLLLRARRDDRARVGPRRGDDQLQPGDGLDRLRHLRPPLLRAAHARGRARRDRGRAAGGRDRPVRRPDAAEARGRPGRRRRAAARHARSSRSTWPRTGPASARCSTSSACSGPPYATAESHERGARGGRRRRLPAAGAPVLRARRPRDGDLLLARAASPTTSKRTNGGAAAGTIFLDRFLENAIEIDVDALCDGEDVRDRRRSCSTSRRPASTRATRPA